MTFLPNIPGSGDLQLVEVLVAYDGPRVLSAQSATGQLFLAGWAYEGDDYDDWMYVPVSPSRLTMVRSGRMTLRDAFVHPEAMLYRIRLSYLGQDDNSVGLIDGKSLPESWLPEPDFLLSIPTPTKPAAVSGEELRRRAESEGRTRLRIEIADSRQLRTEAPTRRVAGLLNATQNTIDNFGLVQLDTDPKQDGRFSRRVIEQMETDVLELAAASFVIELGATDSLDLFGDAPIGAVMARIVQLLSVDLTPDQLWEELADLRPRAAKSFRGLVTELANTGSDVLIGFANTARQYKQQSLTASQVSNLQALLKAIVPDEVREIRGRMELFQGDTAKRRFGLRDTQSGDIYEGRVGEHAIPQMTHAMLDSAYDVLITAYAEVDKGAGETKEKFVLDQLVQPDSDDPVETTFTTLNAPSGPIGL